jgi:hypothetical protein
MSKDFSEWYLLLYEWNESRLDDNVPAMIIAAAVLTLAEQVQRIADVQKS